MLIFYVKLIVKFYMIRYFSKVKYLYIFILALHFLQQYIMYSESYLFIAPSLIIFLRFNN